MAKVLPFDPKAKEILCPDCGQNQWELYGQTRDGIHQFQAIICTECGIVYALANGETRG